MIRLINLRDVRKPHSDDLGALNGLVQQLVGEPFLFFRELYADELTLHFGTPTELELGRFGRETVGSYILAVRASIWLVKTRNAIFLSDPLVPDNAKEVSFSEFESTLKPLTQVAAARAYINEFGRYDLSLTMEDMFRFIIRPVFSNPHDKENGIELPQIADWELFTPEDRYLRAGPGLTWSYLPSNEPFNGK